MSKNQPSPRRKRRPLKLPPPTAAAVFLVLVLLLYGSTTVLPEMTVRVLAAALFVTVGPAMLLWWGLHPKSKLFIGHAEKCPPGQEKTRLIITLFARLAAIGLASFFMRTSYALCQDLAAMQSGHTPLEITGIVTEVDSPRRGGFLVEHVTIATPEGIHRKGDFIMLNGPRLRRGEAVRIWLMPNSRFIVTVRPAVSTGD